MKGRSGRAFLPLLGAVGVDEFEARLGRLGVSSLIEMLRARGVVGDARGVSSFDEVLFARWRGVEGTHSSLSRRCTGRLRERMESAGCSLKCDWSRCGDGIGGKAVGSSISSIGVGAALVPMVVQLK